VLAAELVPAGAELRPEKAAVAVEAGHNPSLVLDDVAGSVRLLGYGQRLEPGELAAGRQRWMTALDLQPVGLVLLA
jgi:hypothetical protein